MKKKISKIWGVGLVVVLVTSLLLAAAPVSAGDQAWSAETLPGATGKLIILDSDVTDVAVAADGTTIYVIDSQLDPGLGYKSTDGGNTWTSMTLHGDNDDPLAIAVAPDDADIVAIIDGTSDEVYVSVNGGTSFSDLGKPKEGALGEATILYDVAVSPADAGIHYIAAAGTEGDSEPNVWYFNLEGTPDQWKETSTGAVALGEADTDTDAYYAVAFSPNFPSDKVMVAISQDVTGAAADAVRLEYFTFSPTKKWGVDGNLPVAVTIETNDGFAAMTKADLVLSPEFLGADTSTHLSFVGLDIGGDADAILQSGLFRVTSALKVLKQDIVTTAVRIQSVDYDGTNVVAGSASDNQVYRSADPTASAPTVSTATTNKRPGGTGETTATIVRFAGENVVAGTTGDMSAFSISSDLGKTFADVSLIDINTAADDISSLAMNDDASVIYMAQDDGVGASVWRKASTWQRVLALDGLADLILEVAPEDANVIYVADEDTVNLWVSQEGGDTKWFIRAAPDDIDDLAVESADTVYIINDNDTVYKSTNTAFTFAAGVDGKMGVGHSLTSLGTDLLIAGGTGGEISYSNDGGASFTELDKEAMTTDGGNIVVTATGLETGDFIFAATTTAQTHIFRWEIGQSGSTWKEIADLAANESVYGIALRDGVLYATVDDTTDSWLYRSLNPTATTPAFSTTTSALERFNVAPNNIWVTSGSTKVWAIDTAADTVFSYTDTTADIGPTLVSPTDGTETLVNQITGGAYDVTFIWSRLSVAATYDLDIATDSAFTETVVNKDGIGGTGATQAYVIGPGVGNTTTTATFNFLPDTTYYWKVRVKTPVLSPYSEVRSFTVASLPDVSPVVLEQERPVVVLETPPPEIVITPPEVVVEVPPPIEVVIPPAAPAPAPVQIPAPVQVQPISQGMLLAIIIIGAVLVIALIVLIVRTRRVV